MNTNQRKKERLFDLFSENLINISKFWGVDFERKEISGNYICPLSFKMFTRDGLNSKYIDQLTIEHVPPESLNGKALCLTSKRENNDAGRTFDKSLQEKIMIEEIKNGKLPLNANVYFEDNIRMKGEFCFGESPSMKFMFHHKSENIETFLNQIKSVPKKEFSFSFSLKTYNQFTTVALLRTAYLTAFGHIGYALLFGYNKVINQNYLEIRNQIANPETISFTNYLILSKGIEKIDSPISIITEPRELRSLLVVFELKTEKSSQKIGVLLPGPDDYKIKSAQSIREDLKKSSSIEFKCITSPKLNLANYDDSIEYYRKWKEIHGMTKDIIA